METIDYYNYIINHSTMRRMYIKAKKEGNIKLKQQLEKELKVLRKQEVQF